MCVRMYIALLYKEEADQSNQQVQPICVHSADAVGSEPASVDTQWYVFKSYDS